MKISTKLFSAAAIAAIATSGINAQTPADPATLNYDPAEIGVIFAADQDTYWEVLKDGNGNVASDWAPVTWGQSCVMSADECAGGASALRIDNLDFLPLQFPATVSLAQWRYLHVDMWAPAEDQVCFKLQNWWPGEAYVSNVYTLKAGEWTSIDIDMEDPDCFQWSEVKTDPETQEKYINKGVNVFQIAGEKIANDYPHCATIYMTNVIAHNYTPADNGENGENGVDGIVFETQKGKTFNIFGLEVDETYKGIVIRNGKKYIQR